MVMSLSKLQEMVKDRGAWCSIVHGVTKSQMWLSDWTTTMPCISHDSGCTGAVQKPLSLLYHRLLNFSLTSAWFPIIKQETSTWPVSFRACTSCLPSSQVSSLSSNCHVLIRLQRRQWHPTPVLLPGKSHGRRSLVGCRPQGRKESDTTEWLHFHFSLSCIGEGNGNPLQCSCLENPRDGGAWWAAIYGVAQSQTQLKWLSSSSIRLHLTAIWFPPRLTPSQPLSWLPRSYILKQML